MSFAADVGDGLVRVGRGVLLAAFGVDAARVDVVLEPGEIFVVVSYHYVHGRLVVHAGLGQSVDLE